MQSKRARLTSLKHGTCQNTENSIVQDIGFRRYSSPTMRYEQNSVWHPSLPRPLFTLVQQIKGGTERTYSHAISKAMSRHIQLDAIQNDNYLLNISLRDGNDCGEFLGVVAIVV